MFSPIPVQSNIYIFLKKCSTEYKYFPAGIYVLKVNNGNTKIPCEICSKLTIKTPERGHWRHFGVFIVNFEQISHIVLVFPSDRKISLLEQEKTREEVLFRKVKGRQW